MKKIQSSFCSASMTWPRVLLFAVAVGVLTAVLKLIPALNDTSFQDIAVYLDCWILFAVFIIVNCKTWWEASAKCFVFFLVSQPLIYLIQVPFSSLGWGLFGYYPRWFLLTVLTIPGAAAAFQVKRKDWLSVTVLSVATGYLACACVFYAKMAAQAFPHHLLSAVFALALALFMIFTLLEDRKHHIAALSFLTAVLIAVSLIFAANRPGSSTVLVLETGNWTVSVDNDAVADVEITEGNRVIVTGTKNGYAILTFRRNDGQIQEYGLLVDGKNLTLDPIG